MMKLDYLIEDLKKNMINPINSASRNLRMTMMMKRKIGMRRLKLSRKEMKMKKVIMVWKVKE